MNDPAAPEPRLDAFDPLDIGAPPPHAKLERHPHVKRLRREIARLQATTDRLLNLQREMVNRDLVAARFLEPVNLAPPGIIEPVGGPTIVHVDNLRLTRNRVMGLREPTIRILIGGKESHQIVHSHEVRLLGPSLLSETYDRPVLRRPAAVVVLETLSPIEVVR